MRPGYVITRTGVHLGMTPALTRHMAFVKLTPKAHAPGVPDWNGAPMTVSVDGVAGRGTMLMDTGINYMFLSPPAGTRLERGRRAPEGTRVELFMPDRQRPQPAFYEFSVGRRGNPLHHLGRQIAQCRKGAAQTRSSIGSLAHDASIMAPIGLRAAPTKGLGILPVCAGVPGSFCDEWHRHHSPKVDNARQSNPTRGELS